MYRKFFGKLATSLKSGSYILWMNVVEKVAFFLSYLCFARFISAEAYAIITTVFAFANISVSFIEFGLPFYFQRETAKQNPQLLESLNQSLTFKSLTLMVFLPAVYGYFRYAGSMDTTVVLFVASAVFLFSVNNMLTSVFYGAALYRTVWLLLLISRIVMVAGIVVTSLILHSFTGAVAFFVISGMLHCLLLLLALRKVFHFRLKFICSLKGLGGILQSSGWIGLSLVFVWIYDRVDVVILEKMLGLQAVAVYAVAYSLYKISQSFISVFLVPAYTQLSLQYGNTGKIDWVHLRFVFLTLLLLSVGCIIFFAFGADSIIRLFYGNRFGYSSVLLPILAYALPGLFLNNLSGVVCNAVSREKIPVISTGIAVVINIILVFYFIGLFGVLGAVYATILTEYLVLILQVVLLALSFRFQFFLQK